MATIKSYTDIKQSRKLAEILPLETADMIWVLANPDLPMIKAIAYKDSEKSKYYETLPAWSLTALLSVLPLPSLIQDKADDELFWQCSVYDEYGTSLCEIYDNNAIDACVAMIEKLHELKML